MANWRYGKHQQKVRMVNACIWVIVLAVLAAAGFFSMRQMKKIKEKQAIEQELLRQQEAEELEAFKKSEYENLNGVWKNLSLATKEEKKELKTEYTSTLKEKIDNAKSKDEVIEIRDDYLYRVSEADASKQRAIDQEAAAKEAEAARIASLSARVLAGKPNQPMEIYSQPEIVAASATSTISQNNGVSNDPMLLFDGKSDTSWQEGVSGYGIGESISASFDKSYKVRYIAFMTGNWKNDKYYYGNAKPKTVTIEVGALKDQVTFSDAKEVQWVELSDRVDADSIRITIDEVYPGTDWEDTCISEITVYADY